MWKGYRAISRIDSMLLKSLDSLIGNHTLKHAPRQSSFNQIKPQDSFQLSTSLLQ